MRFENSEQFKEACGYEINGIWYPRVTKILEVKAKPGLDSFFREIGDYASAEDIKQRSAEEGSLMHRTIQGIMTGKAVDIPETIRPAVEAFQKFNERQKIAFHPEFVERLIWSPRHRYAGTVDTLAYVNGKFGVLDIKTSIGFYPEYNLQTAAYISALQEFLTKRTLGLPEDVTTRWILRIDQRRVCKQCNSTWREKGGRVRIRENGEKSCAESKHEWGGQEGDVALREFPYFFNDIRAFVAAKTLWEWDNNYWLRQIGYSR